MVNYQEIIYTFVPNLQSRVPHVLDDGQNSKQRKQQI